MYIADGFRGRLTYPEQYKYVTERLISEKDTSHGIEQALHGLALLQGLRRDKKLSRYALKGIRADTDKYTRALAWANRAEAGQVVLVRGPWIADFLEEVCRFPDGKHDDQVDAVSLAVRMLSENVERKPDRGF